MKKRKKYSLNDTIGRALKAHCEYIGVEYVCFLESLIWNALQGTPSPDAIDHLGAFKRQCDGGCVDREKSFNPYRIDHNSQNLPPERVGTITRGFPDKKSITA